MFRFALAWLGLLVLVPAAAACTAPALPHHPVFVEIVQNGSVVLRADTGNVWSADPCIDHDLGHPAFDGRFAAWSTPVGASVADAVTRNIFHVDVQGPWSLGTGRLLQIVGGTGGASALRVTDLATQKTSTVGPPSGTRFRFVSEAFALAVANDGDAAHGTFLYDAASSTWLVRGLRLDTPAWPAGTKTIVGANSQWILVQVGDRGLWAYDVGRTSARGPLPSAAGVAPAGARLVELRHDVAYLAHPTSSAPDAAYSEAAWSVSLSDLQVAGSGRPPPLTIGNRTAWYTLGEVASPTPDASNPPGFSDGASAVPEQAKNGEGGAAGGVGAVTAVVASLVGFLLSRRRNE